MQKLLLIFVLLMGSINAIFSQESVSGTVTDANTDQPVAGVAVLIKGTTVGAYTDEEGRYSLDLTESATVIQFSFVGYKTLEEQIQGRSTINVEMEEDILELDEVVVTGFSTVRKKDVTGSISSVDADAIEAQPVVTIQNALQGRAAGVQVTNNSGTPGGGIDVRVRGSTSITASNQPLYVVDGVPVIAGNFSQNGVGNAETNALADINPNDIESIEVLKDASTAAIYGSRGANGVVLITTKKGSAGRTTISLDASYGIQEAWNTVSLLDTAGYFALLDEQSLNGFGVPAAGIGLGRVSSNGGDNFWQDEVFRTGSITDNTLSISGGSDKTKFFSSLSYFQNEGIVQKSEFDRYSGRLNIDHRASDKFKMGMNMNFVHSNAQRVQNDNNIFGAVSSAILMPPDVRIRREDGSFDTKFGLENPVAAVTDYQNNAITNRLISNIFGEYEFFSGFSFRVNVGVDMLSFREEVYEPSTLQSGAGSNGVGFVGQATQLRWLTDYTLNYLKDFGSSNLSVIVGAGFQKDTRERSDIERVGFPSPEFTTLDAASETTSASADFTENTLNSYFGNINYAYDDRYIITGTFRADGYSAFSEDNRFGFFPGVSGAWRISGESFLQNSNFVNDLKVRVGWGVTGNNNIGDFDALALAEAGANYLDLPGTSPTQLGNPELQWETTTQLNIGLDFTIVNSRISGSVDYFIKNTDDLLLDRPLPTTSGFTIVTENIGEVENRGIEFAINTVNITGPFTWTTSFNIAAIDNEVIALFNEQPIDVGFASRVEEGASIGSFFGWVTDGLFQDQGEIDALNELSPTGVYQTGGTAPGDIRFRDLNGDGVINDNDRQIIGSAQPDFIGGLTNIFSFKGLELNTFFQFSVGNDIYNNNAVFAEGMNSVFNATQRVENRWRQAGDQTDMPRAVWNDPNNNRRDSDRFVEDGSYLRLRTASLSYNFPLSITGATPFSGIRIYVQGQNLWTVTDYSWFDPEVNTFDGSNTSLGTDFLTFPQPRTYLAGINLTF